MEKQARAQSGKLLLGSETVTEEALELEKTFYEQQSFGVVKQHLHPDTGKRAHVYISDMACRMLGLHAEEALARIASRELPLITTEFNYLCYVMFGTWSFATRPGRPFIVYTRIRDLSEQGESSCLVAKIVQQPEFDCHGRIRYMKTFMLPLDKDGFDTSEEPANSPYSMIETHMKAGKDFETWRSDFEADLFAVRARSSRQLLADREVAGGDDLGVAEVEARDGATGGAGEGPRADVPAVRRACGEDLAGEAGRGDSRRGPCQCESEATIKVRDRRSLGTVPASEECLRGHDGRGSKRSYRTD
eukprot:764513-Hanusia_phi.AAC.1